MLNPRVQPTSLCCVLQHTAQSVCQLITHARVRSNTQMPPMLHTCMNTCRSLGDGQEVIVISILSRKAFNREDCTRAKATHLAHQMFISRG